MESKFRSARKASDISLKQAAKLSGLGDSTYPLRENNPDDFRLRELRGMYSAMSDTAKPILIEAAIDAIKGSIQGQEKQTQ